MRMHNCPFCGENIAPEEILFVNEKVGPYRDKRRYDFLYGCCSQWEFQTDMDHQAVFMGTYYRPLGQEADRCLVDLVDADGYPRTIKVPKSFTGVEPQDLDAVMAPAPVMYTPEPVAPMAPAAEPAPAAVGYNDPLMLDDLDLDMGLDMGYAPQQQPMMVEPAMQPVEQPMMDPYGMEQQPMQQQPVFNPRGEQTTILSTRACPHCHSRLPTMFGQLDTLNVSLMGGRAAGKTAFLISLVHQLNTQLSARDLGSVSLLPESQQYYELQNKFFQESKGNPMPTPVEERLFPFVFEYHNNAGAEKSCFIAIYDVAGEGMKNMDYLLNHNGLRSADILMLMLDTNMINGGLYNANFNVNMDDGGMPDANPHDCYSGSLHDFLSNSVKQIQDFNMLGNIKHVIAVTTKIDYPLMANPELFRGMSEMKFNLAHGGKLEHRKGFELAVQQALETSIVQFYRAPGDGSSYDIRGLIKNAMPDVHVHLMAVSTWTREETGNEHISFTNRYQPDGPKHRIIEPFLMILALKRMIDIFRVPRKEVKKKCLLQRIFGKDDAT